MTRSYLSQQIIYTNSTSSGTVFVDGVVKEFSVRDGDYMKVKTYTGRTNNSRNKRGGFRRILTVEKTKLIRPIDS